MGRYATPTLHRLRGHEQEHHASVRSTAVWLLLCSPIPSSRFSIAQIRTYRHTLGRSGCVVVVGIPQRAYISKLQESYQSSHSDITWPSLSSTTARGLFVCLPWQRPLSIGQSFVFQFGLCWRPSTRESLCSSWLYPHVSAVLARWSASISRERRRKTHMLARYQECSSLSWLAGTVATGASDGSIRRSIIGPVAEERPREFEACMQHSLTWREHTRARSIGIQSAYRQGLRSCRDITTCHMGGALPTNRVRPLLVHASCVPSLLGRSSNRSSEPEAT